jgi:DNA-binding CsgD family transcriptional regulator
MAHLSQRDVRAFLGFLKDIYAKRGLEDFRRRIIAALPALIACETASYNEVNAQTGQSTWLVEPDSPAFLEYRPVFQEHIREHPLVRHYAKTGDGHALKISDFLSRSQFHSLGLYTEFYRRRGVEHQLAVTLPTRAPGVIGIAVNRLRPDFTERDRLCLNLLRPHLVQAYRNAAAVAQSERDLDLVMRGMDALGRGVVLLNARGRVRVMTSEARRSLAELFGDAALRNQRLPEDIELWVHQQENHLDLAAVPVPRKPLLIERGGKRFLVRLIADLSQTLLLLEDRTRILSATVLGSLGISNREAEVLAWICQGKSNQDIATILSLSVRTVEKHVERIFLKLGVETRTAAALVAQQFAEDQTL